VQLLFTIPDFWPHVRRGSERIVHDLSVSMARRGHDVTVLTCQPGGRGRSVRTEGFAIRYVGTPIFPGRRGALAGLELFALQAMARGLGSPAALHHAFYITDAYGLVQAARLRRRPVVFSWHGVPDATWWELHMRRIHHQYRAMAARADRVTVMAESSARRFRDDYHAEPTVLVPGIFVDDYALPKVPPARPRIVSSAAMDDPRKRIDVLVDAFGRLVSWGHDVELVLVGGDPTPVRRLVAAQPEEVRQRITASATISDLAPIYAGATIGALSSENEAFGLVALEYQASGMPAVVGDDGGSGELVSTETGRTFRRGDGADCARALAEALDLACDPRTANHCREHARQWDWTVRGDAYEDIYRALT